jgi:hypothetical protein
MLVEFTISVEVDEEDQETTNNAALELSFDKLLANMEDCVGKANLELNDSSWNYI